MYIHFTRVYAELRKKGHADIVACVCEIMRERERKKVCKILRVYTRSRGRRSAQILVLASMGYEEREKVWVKERESDSEN